MTSAHQGEKILQPMGISVNDAHRFGQLQSCSENLHLQEGVGSNMGLGRNSYILSRQIPSKRDAKKEMIDAAIANVFGGCCK